MKALRRSLPAVIALTLSLTAAPEAQAATTVMQGGAVYTLDPAHPWASAIVIRGGRIVYVGDDRGSQAYVGRGVRVLALRGRMVLPGFHDAHSHPMSGAMRLLRCQLGAAKSESRLHFVIRRCIASTPADRWLLGVDWSPATSAPGGPTLETLDRLAPDRPAFLTTHDGFAAWANSRALRLAGIDPSGTEPLPAGVRRDPGTGRPTGVLEGDATELVRRKIPTPSEAEYREALRRAAAMANRFGITSVFDASATPPMLDAYHAADVAGDLSLRVVAAQRVDTERGPDQVEDMIARRDRVRGRRFRADAAKIFVDGEISQHTAALLEPYADAPGVRGDLFVQCPRLNALVLRLDAEGFLVHMHVMGDGAVRAGLDAFEAAAQANGPRDRRHQLAHIGVAAPEDVARFGRLGVAANLQPMWFSYADPDAAPSEAALGPARSRLALPAASVAAGGGRLVMSSDWPSTSMNPLDGIQSAVTRRPLEANGAARRPEERVDLATALAAYTKNAAWAAREDDIDGDIEVGKAADLVVLDRNLFEVDASRLHRARVLLTLLDGRPVYRNPSIAWRRAP